MSVGPLLLKGLESLPHPFTAMSPVLEKAKVQLVLQTVSQFPWHFHHTVKLWICIPLPQMPKWLGTSKSVNTSPVLGVSAKKVRQGKLSEVEENFHTEQLAVRIGSQVFLGVFFPNPYLLPQLNPVTHLLRVNSTENSLDAVPERFLSCICSHDREDMWICVCVLLSICVCVYVRGHTCLLVCDCSQATLLLTCPCSLSLHPDASSIAYLYIY